MSSTLRPTKPGTLSLSSRPAKRATGTRSARPPRSGPSAPAAGTPRREPSATSPSEAKSGVKRATDRPARPAASTRPARSASNASARPATTGTTGRASPPAKPARSAPSGGTGRAQLPVEPGMKRRAAKPGTGGADSRQGSRPDRAPQGRSPQDGTPKDRAPKDRSPQASARPSRGQRPAQAPAAANSERLAKRLATELPCSRADAERYIEGGWVTVNGKVQEEPGLRVTASQTVSLLPGAKLEEGRPVTILIHKPAGMYADDQPGSARDLILPENLMPGDRSGQRYLKRMFNGLKLVTPLERAASGLVVYTQEFAVARKLVDEGRHVEQEYVAQVEGQLSEADLVRMQRGMAYEGRPATPMKVSWQNETHLRFALKSPMPGFIEAVCEAAGLRLLALRRLRIGRLPMAGLAAGQWRYRLEYERF
ncbi:hypothetical protein LMG26684_01067 [Achromobacter mucicolens]|nr:hypothetical protein LMG26684_01067 [Achromobacter mucicolens]